MFSLKRKKSEFDNQSNVPMWNFMNPFALDGAEFEPFRR